MAELSSCVKCLRDYKIIESIQMITSAKHDGYILVVACSGLVPYQFPGHYQLK